MAYQEGDTSPPHINVHNDLVSKLAQISAEYDLDLVLPPQRNIGDTEHVKDHNLITDALQAIDDWEAAGGGAPGAAVIGGATGAVTESSFTGDGTNGDAGQAYDVYEFTGSGELVVSQPGLADVLVVGGGGSGAVGLAGGAGAGAHHYITNAYLSLVSRTVTVGAGGAGAVCRRSTVGIDGLGGFGSRIDNYLVPGGGGGGSFARNNPITNDESLPGQSGGSGGGAGGYAGPGDGHSAAVGSAMLVGLGNDGGAGNAEAGGGGGGAGAVGANATSGGGGNGGAGAANSITGSAVTRGGGGGGSSKGTQGSGGSGGGGAAVASGTPNNGTANTGGGGGGNDSLTAGQTSGNGGSGIVIVRVKVASESYPFRTQTTAPKTAHAARIEDGIVRQVIVIPHLDDDDAKITEYCNRIGLAGTWVDTSYTGARRGKYAGVGDTFTMTKSGGEFISPTIEEEPVTLDLPGEEQ